MVHSKSHFIDFEEHVHRFEGWTSYEILYAIDASAVDE